MTANAPGTSGLLKEAQKFGDQAGKYFECGDAKFNLNDIPAFAGSRIAENFKSGDVTDSVVERWSMPTRFGDRYASQIDSSPRQIDHVLVGCEA